MSVNHANSESAGPPRQRRRRRGRGQGRHPKQRKKMTEDSSPASLPSSNNRRLLTCEERMEISYQRVTSLLQQREGGDLEYLEYDWDDDGIRIPPADRCRYDINDMYDTRENDADSNDDLEDDTTMGNSDRVASAAAPTTTTKSATSSRMGKHPHHRSSKNYINNYIAVIPSLVSLAEDFFLCDDVSPPAAVAAATTFYASGARAGGNRGMTSMTLSEEDSESGEMMFPQEEGGVQDIIMMERNEHHGHHHRHREHPPPSLTTTLRPRPAANNNIDDLDITLGHHTSRYNYGFLNDNTYDDDPPPEDWPVGPQGAPIPSHLLLRQYHHNRSPSMEESTSRRRRHRRRRRHYDYHDGISFHEEGEEDEMGEPNSRVDDVLSNTALDQQSPSLFASAASSASSTAAASDVSTNARESMLNDGNHAQPSSLPLLQQLPPSPSVPPPPSLLSPPSPPFGLRRRQHQPRSNDTLHNNTTTTNSGGWGWREQRRFQNQTVLSTPPPSAVNINAVKFLDHAVTRLENKLSTQSTTSSSSNIDPISATSTQQQQQQYNIEELESNLLTQLVEIMLNPPTTTTVTAKQTTTNLMEDDSTNACDNNEHVCSSREDDDDEESSGSDKHHDDDDFDIDDDDGEEEEEEEEEDDTMTITGASSGETSNSDTKTRPPILFKSCSSTSSSTPAIMTPFSKQHGTKYPTIASAKLAIQQLGQMVPQRRVCQYAFKRNDIVWVCRTCQSDETCVLCHECFRNSNHEGHDVAFYHAQAGGCCDCGDEDAWSPKGFCGRHGGPSSTTTSKNDNEVEVEKEENPTMTMLTKIEPAVLGAVRAIADYLAVVVRSGVEAGYRRANPASAFHASTTSASALGADNINDDTLLPEYYDEHDGGRDRRHQREFRRYHSLHRRNTVADMETAPDTSLPMLHEAQFIPSLASTSASASQRWTSNPSASEAEEIDMPTGNRVFDPNAAGSSSSYSSSPKFTSASNHCAAKMECGNTSDLEPDNPTRDKAPPGRSPARALGDLGREEHGLFLVLHCDDIHMGHPPSSSSHQSSSYNRSEVIAALKELYSAPGGGGGKVGDAIAGVSSGVHHIPDMWGGGGGGGAHVFGTTNRFTRQPDRLLLSPSRYSLFRAPQAEAILDRIVQIVKMQGDLIVWGTQEILAECGDVNARLWRYGDPQSSTLIGAAVLNRARILRDRGLVCSIKTRKNLCDEQRATAALRLIGWMASSCDPLCDQVSLGILGRRVGVSALLPLLRNDLKLPYQFVMAWHSLLLTLLAVPNFKAAMANAYCDTYREVTAEYSRGVGLIERSSYTLSVQFLNRVSYVTDLVRERNLLFNLSRCLLETMQMASFKPGSPGSPPPAGASSDTMNDLDARTSPSASLTAALLVMLGSFSPEGGNDANIARLDAEINDLILGMAGNVSGGDSRHHGRSAVTKNSAGAMAGSRNDSSTHRYLLERTAALVLPTLDPSHTVLSHRRYSVCISDLKCVLNVNGMARYFASLPIDPKMHVPMATSSQVEHNDYFTIISTKREANSGCPLDDWIQTLSLAQQMDGQMWRPWVKGHVETEPKGWVGAFNASISLSSLFERLLNWDDSDPSPIDNCNLHFLSCVELTHYTLAVGLLRWQRSEMLSYRPTRPPSRHLHPTVPEYALSSASLPFSTVASSHGSVLAMAAIPLPQIAVWSFHLPLHRFAASCIREVSRRQDDAGESGMDALLDMFVPPVGEGALTQLRLNAMLVRGLMEFPAIVLSRAAQIRAGIWRRNGPGMNDQVLNYSEPPFCRGLADADMLLLQFSLLCHSSRVGGRASMGGDDPDSKDSIARLAFAGQGTARLTNLLLHRFGVFDFLGFEVAPTASVDQYKNEIERGLYPPEIEGAEETDESSREIVLPWTSYCPAPDPSTCMALVQELLHLIILLITEMPPPSHQTFSEHAFAAKRRMKREVIHRLASGNKTHSEMAEVSCVLSQRDNAVLCKTFVNPDDASGAALEDALSEVAVRKQRSGAPDEWELRKDAWREYDPAFHHISTRAHQSATENRPKPLPAAPYAPRPASAHSSFKRIRRDLTADSCILAVAYRILHVHCYESNIDSSVSHVRGDSMYDDKSKSETVLARAIHLLTLGAYAWEDASIDNEQSTDWRDLGGGDVGSVFYNREIAPSACDWVAMAFLSDPSEVMSSEWYIGKDNALTLLQKIGFEAGDSCGFLGGIDPALRSGAAYLCKFAAKMNPDAVSASGGLCNSPMKEGEQERKKNAAKEKAMAMMKEKMAKFAANIGNSPGFDDDDMSEDIDESRSPSRGSNEASTFSTPVRNRSDSEIGVLSPAREFNLSSPMASPNSPYTPRTPQMTSPRTTAQNSCPRLMNERPQCIVCGGDSHDPMQVDASLSGDLKLNSHTNFLLEGFTSNEKALAFCGYSQASTVFIGGDRVPTRGRITTAHVQSHVGVHITLCGHAIHKDCCDAYLKTVASQRFDRLEGGKKREFRCPLCQRLSNCLIPFVDVAADWTDMVVQKKHSETNVSSSFSSADESLMQIDFRGEAERTQIDKSHGCAAALNDFLSSSKWWATRNDMSVSWDGQCTFSANKDDTKPSELPLLSSPRQSLMKLQSKFGKKELVSAWNSVLRTPRLVTRRVRSSSTDRVSIFTYDPNEVSRQKESSSDVLRRFIDQVSDVSHRADMRRLGEENLFSNFGEFRHYLSEKAAYNKDNRAAGKEMVDWPQCLSTSTLSESRRQELSREKLISKMMLSIQAFTYTCCSEAAEARQLLQQSSTSDMPSILSKFGLSQVSFGGDLLLFPEANPSVDGGYQPFDGRLGKLRYLSLALMAATSPVSLEVVQLCMSFPDAQPDPFDFGSEEKSLIKRAPVAYPILCSHVLTHTTGALIAVCGRARVEEGKYGIDSVADDCRHLIHLGLVARVSQVILARLRLYIDDDLVLEQHVYSLLEQNAMQIIASSDKDEQNWRHFGVAVIRVLLSPAKPEFKPAPPTHCSCSTDEDEVLSHVLHAVEAAKTEVIAFLRDIALICQLLIPNIFCANVECRHDSQERYSAIELFNRYMELFNMENHQLMLESDLLQDIMKSWYAGSIGTSTKRLDFPRAFHGMTWPVTTSVNNPEIPTNSVPLLGNTIGIGLSSRILHLPKSYTDLYATLSEIYPDSEQTAVCLVCGQILNAAGKGDCTKHSYKCGGGAGIYFLVQECIGLLIHEQKAAYIHSPYVDFFGETPQYRGRPLNLSLDRYHIMRSLWTGHLIREKVVAERASTRQVIIPNFY